MPDRHIPDSKVYNELQVLKDFMRFITGLEPCDDRCKRDAETILEYIEQLDHPLKKECWSACLNIFARELQERRRDDPNLVCIGEAGQFISKEIT